MNMNRRQFIGASSTALAGAAAAASSMVDFDHGIDTIHDPKGPYSIEIVSPPEESARELPLFDSYKQAENFAQARMNLLRQNDQLRCDAGWVNTMRDHEAGLIKVWSSDAQVVFECAWGETWTMAYSYVNCKDRLN